ncbi:hypothetical protein LPB19_11580 [Marinobacter salinisoli]|uniref:Flagellar protein FliL n=1 Tax=Marinobacter salinisoli TaxID=2769486 RepID=A0ABX7MNI8_9GAMM|nr:hypothetical protein [Marinobacter salinisoli]QSP93837.1 hypothetical protein LPB19_11580 [Marinobacter salinisoli]
MATFLIALTLLLVAFSAFLCWQLIMQQQLITRMLKENDLAGSMEEPELVLTLRVIDPIGLAKRESKSARVLADKLPIMVRKMVYQEVMKELQQEMSERNIPVKMHIEYR